MGSAHQGRTGFRVEFSDVFPPVLSVNLNTVSEPTLLRLPSQGERNGKIVKE